MKEKIIEILKGYELSDSGDVIIYTTEFNKIADEILALLAKEPITNPNQPTGSTTDFILEQKPEVNINTPFFGNSGAKIPIEEPEGVTAEEILLANESLFQEHPFEEMYFKDKDAILKCMESYASSKQIDLKKELIEYQEYLRNAGYAGLYEHEIDEYLNNK